ncbi:hypothetical protein [Maribacter halichondriae]|uniref:hypothetical protein n=1 Tax=Maribacter halichondriae TaxID=2980554 RepID=UPI002358C320|nr:hypothetical protein [Maribacter sp. Hal144]
MNDRSALKPPTWFWIVAALALLWNLMGVGAYLFEAFMSDEMMAAMPEAQRELYETRPSWVTAAYAIAVWFGALGCIGLLIRKKWATSLLVLSLLGVLAQNVYSFFMSNVMEVSGSGGMIFAVFIIIISIALVFFSRHAASKQWLT